ncbi:MAG TPA: hypothetical protein VGI81_14330 [Tepidisphaeraceae bacterium]|jgi:hypothetical protein
MKVRYFDECKWVDTGEGLAFEFQDPDGETLARIALRDGEAKLWTFEVMLPPRHQLEECRVGGVVFSQIGARRVAETILLHTIVTR